MNFYQVEIFLEVVKLGGITKAARKLLLSQPTVTVHIKQLEDEMGCQLINRKRGIFSLTREGKRFFRFAEYITREKQNLTSDITRMHQGLTGKLNLISTLTIAEFILPTILYEFKSYYPSIDIEVTAAHPYAVEEAIWKETDVIGFTINDNPKDGVVAIKIAEDQRVFITYPGHPFTLEKEVALSDLIGETLISQGPLNISDFLKIKGVDLDDYPPQIIIGSAAGVVSSVESKLGIGLISRAVVKKSEALGMVKVINVKDFSGYRTAYCVYKKDSPKSVLTKGFIDFMVNYSKSRGFSKVRHRN